MATITAFLLPSPCYNPSITYLIFFQKKCALSGILRMRRKFFRKLMSTSLIDINYAFTFALDFDVLCSFFAGSRFLNKV